MADSPGRISLWMVEVFAAIAEERSISSAARRLEASPSAVSQQLSNLEAGLSTRLVDRSARPLTLTPEGHIFLRRARNILDEADLARAELARRDMANLARFRLGMIEDFDADVTPRLLTEMAEDLRACRFLLETGASHRLFTQLDERALDVIVAADTSVAADWMEVHPLLAEPFVAALPKGGAEPVVLADLRELPFVQYTQRHHMGRQIAAHLSRQNVSLLHRFEMDSYHAILAMVAQGAGWTILTPLGFLRAHRFFDDVRICPLPMEPLSRRISLHARREVMGRVPAQTAARLRAILQDMIVAPSVRQMPWLAGQLKVLDSGPGAAAP
ncbi:LysR family transcriptional regulator [Fluviibacterium sp. DFM31]|uniref:LysR family transcriptional regulator n=1 Tax=Meridianimarinicoccus marinus TaxID=3231483 RepID=A0ABV3L4I9_9RHOB